jgi:hypothetical protein
MEDHMASRTVAITIGLLGLAACGGSSDYERSAAAPAPPPPAIEIVEVTDESFAFEEDASLKIAQAGETTPAPSSETGEPSATQYIAYSHSMGLTLP